MKHILTDIKSVIQLMDPLCDPSLWPWGATSPESLWPSCQERRGLLCGFSQCVTSQDPWQLGDTGPSSRSSASPTEAWPGGVSHNPRCLSSSSHSRLLVTSVKVKQSLFKTTMCQFFPLIGPLLDNLNIPINLIFSSSRIFSPSPKWFKVF